MRFYVNDYLFVIQQANAKNNIEGEELSIFSTADAGQVMAHYHLVKSGRVKGKTTFVFEVKDYKKIVEDVKNQFKIIEAAGGIVEKENDILLIYRLNKWDLPKGKMEKGETPENTAVREVEEECGVQTELRNKIGETWHTYDLKGKEILKCTHWYRMACKSDVELKPQTEEAIDEVKWMAKTDAADLLIKQSYASIADIYEQYVAQQA